MRELLVTIKNEHIFLALFLNKRKYETSASIASRYVISLTSKAVPSSAQTFFKFITVFQIITSCHLTKHRLRWQLFWYLQPINHLVNSSHLWLRISIYLPVGSTMKLWQVILALPQTCHCHLPLVISTCCNVVYNFFVYLKHWHFAWRRIVLILYFLYHRIKLVVN